MAFIQYHSCLPGYPKSVLLLLLCLLNCLQGWSELTPDFPCARAVKSRTVPIWTAKAPTASQSCFPMRTRWRWRSRRFTMSLTWTAPSRAPRAPRPRTSVGARTRTRCLGASSCPVTSEWCQLRSKACAKEKGAFMWLIPTEGGRGWLMDLET